MTCDFLNCMRVCEGEQHLKVSMKNTTESGRGRFVGVSNKIIYIYML